ncbi:hypothetical protein ACWPKO_06275 [Coraliomargarita sp. W4R53]
MIGLTVWFQFADPLAHNEEAPQGQTPEWAEWPAPTEPDPIQSARREGPAPAPTAFSFATFQQQRQQPETTDQYIIERPASKVTTARTQTKPTYTAYQNTRFAQSQGDYPFYVAEKKWDNRKQAYNFYRVGMQGNERVIRHDVRRYFISENQSDYPEPEGGCGPTALLNLYVWYSKFGLIHESVKHSNPFAYKQLKFKQIDRIINQIQGRTRSRADGTNVVEQVLAIDELVRKASDDKTRIHFEYKQPPLTRKDFLNLTRNYRAGILSVRPKDPETGQLMGYHAVLVIRGDTSGKISIANWGKFSHGRLVDRKGTQWFVPDDSTQYEMQIEQLTTLIPFTPTS